MIAPGYLHHTKGQKGILKSTPDKLHLIVKDGNVFSMLVFWWNLLTQSQGCGPYAAVWQRKQRWEDHTVIFRCLGSKQEAK